MEDQAALYNLKAVVQQTGLRPDTLRAWERRYGLPTPARSGGRQRLYTPRDIQILLWLEARQREGLTIARAVDLFRQIESEGRDPLLAPAAVPPPATSLGEAHAPGSTLGQLRQQWLSACLAYDREQADHAAAQAFALFPPETVCFDLLEWAVRQVGKLWRQGAATVQQEHFVTEQAIGRLEALLVAAPPATRPGRLLTACPHHEHHTFGLLLLTVLLRRRGWSVVYLGADVPSERLDAALTAIRPSLVILAAQRLPTAAALLETARSVQGRAPIGYAGAVFNDLPEIRARIPGFCLGESIEAALVAVDPLVLSPRAAPPAAPISSEAHAALSSLRQHRPAIQARVAEAAAAAGLSSWQGADGSADLICYLEAALELGGTSLLDAGGARLRYTLMLSGVEPDRLPLFLQACLRAAEAHLDARGEPLLAWLRRHA